MVHDQHERGAVGSRIDREVLRDAGEAGEVVAGVLDGAGKDIEVVELGAGTARKRCDIGAAALRHGPCRHRRVLHDVDLHLRMLGQKSPRLADRLLMGVDVADIVERGPMLREHIVVDLDAGAAHDREVVLHHEVVDLVHRACGRVLDREHAELAEALLDCTEDAVEGIEIGDRRVLEDAVGCDLGIGAFDALAGDIGGLREELGLVCDRIRDLRADIAHDTEIVVFLRTRRLHEEAHEDLRIVAVLVGHLLRDACQLLALAGTVEDRQAVRALVCSHLIGALHALLEELHDAGIDAVEVLADV